MMIPIKISNQLSKTKRWFQLVSKMLRFHVKSSALFVCVESSRIPNATNPPSRNLHTSFSTSYYSLYELPQLLWFFNYYTELFHKYFFFLSFFIINFSCLFYVLFSFGSATRVGISWESAYTSSFSVFHSTCYLSLPTTHIGRRRC